MITPSLEKILIEDFVAEQLSNDFPLQRLISFNRNYIENIKNREEITCLFWSWLDKPILEELLRILPNLHWIFTPTADVSTLCLDNIQARGIELCTCSGLHSKVIAETVLWAMLSNVKQAKRLFENQRNHFWDTDLSLDTLHGKKLLIIGYGSIGKEIARLAKPFGLKITGVARHTLSDTYAKVVKPQAAIREATCADFVIISAPLTDETRHFINSEFISSLKNSPYIINVARGPIIDESALLAGLKNQTISGCYLDVFDKEPLTKTSPLWDEQNVMLSPHVSYSSPNAREKMFSFFTQCYQQCILERRNKNGNEKSQLF